MEKTESFLRMPTGIASIDPVCDGGLPAGSVVLLLGETGAGSSEFVYTTLMYLTLATGAPEETPPGTAVTGGQESRAVSIVRPESVVYISVTRRADDIRNEIASSFLPDLTARIGAITFHDLSERYFEKGMVPASWYADEDVIARMRSLSRHDDLLRALVTILDGIPPRSLVVIDSLTDIAGQTGEGEGRADLSAFLRGLQRVAKAWNTTVLLLLTTGILEPVREVEFADIADAVLLFRWEETHGSRRQRVMYFQKFRGLMPHLEERDLVKFSVRITPAAGFEVSNVRVVI